MTFKFELCLVVTLMFMLSPSSGDEKPKEKTPDKAKVKKEAEKPPAGKAEVLRKLPKKFARFISADAKKLEVRLQIEGEPEPKTWKVAPDAEIKLLGWWGRLEQFQADQRAWVWFDIDRKQQARGVLMLCDEISEQVIHGQRRTLEAVDIDKGTITLKPAKGGSRAYRMGFDLSVLKKDEECQFFSKYPGAKATGKATAQARIGEGVFAQTSGDVILFLLDAEELKNARTAQKNWLRERWQTEGLPGTVTFLHRLGGEMEVMLDHEAMRWGRYLKNGDKVALVGGQDTIGATVISSAPWRERTHLRLVVGGLEQTELDIGQRMRLRMPDPPLEVQNAELPSDIGRPRTREERVEWFLASTYCACKVGGDGCTGMFYSLASCNTNACAMPNQVRAQVEKLIDKGLTDEQIYAELKRTRGAIINVPHLLP